MLALPGLGADAQDWLSLAGAASLFLIVLACAWLLLRAGESDLFAAPPVPSREKPAAPPPDLGLLADLERLMQEERLYRREDLSIGRLAARLRVPEHRLRRAINGHLGHRNFNAFVNGLRLAEVKAALADPAQAPTPITTIALDAGFSSLGPFNRAFRADTGLTPSQYRKLHLGRDSSAGPVVDPGLADF